MRSFINYLINYLVFLLLLLFIFFFIFWPYNSDIFLKFSFTKLGFLQDLGNNSNKPWLFLLNLRSQSEKVMNRRSQSY